MWCRYCDGHWIGKSGRVSHGFPFSENLQSDGAAIEFVHPLSILILHDSTLAMGRLWGG